MTLNYITYDNQINGFYSKRYDLPDRNLIVTGIPRSGTSLYSTLLNELPDVYCMNEVLYNMNRCPHDLAVIRYNLIHKIGVPNKYKEGELATNTGTDKEIQLLSKVIDKPFSERCIVGSNVNLPYLNNINWFIRQKYKIIGIIRDPLYSIASWNMPYCSKMQMANLAYENMYPIFFHIPFVGETNYERQAELWNHYAEVLHKLEGAKKLEIIKYEDLVKDPEGNVEFQLIHMFSRDEGPYIKWPKLKNNNTEEQYRGVNLKEIEEALQKYAPARGYFNY